jgi:hypothetical protein
MPIARGRASVRCGRDLPLHRVTASVRLGGKPKWEKTESFS